MRASTRSKRSPRRSHAARNAAISSCLFFFRLTKVLLDFCFDAPDFDPLVRHRFHGNDFQSALKAPVPERQAPRVAAA